ncbi:MAG: hypothetical protein ACTS5I_07250 [Rhodanobacter sp.]
MAWTNVYDIGACTVEVYQSGVLVPVEDYATVNIASIEEVDGVVTVTSTADPHEIRGLDFRVVPSYDTRSLPVRVIDAQLVFSDAAYNSIEGAGAWLATAILDSEVALTSDGEFPTRGYTPNPAVVTPPNGGWDAAGLVGGSE